MAPRRTLLLLLPLLAVVLWLVLAPEDSGERSDGADHAAAEAESDTAALDGPRAGAPEPVEIGRAPVAADEEPPLAGLPAAPPAQLRITVHDEQGAPVADARLWSCILDGDPYMLAGRAPSVEQLRGWGQLLGEARSDAQGQALLEVPEDVQVKVMAAAPGRMCMVHATRSGVGGEVTDGGTITMPPGRDVTLRMVEEDGTPVPDIDVWVRVWMPEDIMAHQAPVSQYTVRADAGGVVLLRGIPEGALMVRPRGPFVEPDHEQGLSLQVDAGVDDARVVVDRGLWVSGTLRHADGSPVAGAEMTLHPFDWGEAEPGMKWQPWGSTHYDWSALRSRELSGADGSFRVSGVGEGALYSVAAMLQPDQVYATPLLDRHEAIDFRIPDRHGVRGRVTGLEDVAQCTVVFDYRWPNARRDESWEVPDASFIFLWGKSPPCGADGSFERMLPAGRYEVRVTAPGLDRQLFDALEVRGPLELGELALPGGGEVLLKVPQLADRWEDPGIGLRIEVQEKVRGFLDDEEKLVWRRAGGLQADRSVPGEFRLRQLRDLPHRLLLSAPGALPRMVDLGRPPSGPEPLVVEVAFEPVARLEVLVRDAAGLPKADVQLRCRPLEAHMEHPAHAALAELDWNYGSDGRDAVTTADGVARFPDLPPGRFEVLLLPGRPEARPSFEREQNAKHVAEAELGLGETRRIEFLIDSLASLRVEVLEGDAAVAGALVEIGRVEERGIWGTQFSTLAEGTTDAAGVFLAEGLGAGEFLVRARRGEWEAPTEAEVTVIGKLESVRVPLAGGGFRYRAIDASGKGLPSWCEIARIPEQPQALDLMSCLSDHTVGRAGADAEGQGGGARLMAGVYRIQVSAQTADGSYLWGVSEPFTVDQGIVDVGDVVVGPLARGEFTIGGLSAWSGRDFDLMLERVGDELLMRVLYISTWNDQDEDSDDTAVPEGDYRVVAVDEDGTRLWRSEPLALRAGQEFAHRLRLGPPPAQD